MKKKNGFYISMWLVIAMGLVLTLVSLFHLCSEACVEGHNYRIFGMYFEVVGLIFFASLGVIHFLSRRFTFLEFFLGILFAGALGAELMFMITQKYMIGKWCPVCLGIAACVAVGTGLSVAKLIKQFREAKKQGKKEEVMKFFQKGIISAATICMGFVVAFLGVTKHDAMEAAQASIRESLAFGNKESDIEVYLFTDWACPACRQLEPSVEKIAEEVMKNGQLIFVDHVIHPETLNFIPYHLSFILHNKPHYFQLREMLTEISEETGAPDEDEIAAASAKFGVKYEELDYSDISFAIRYFKKLGEKFKIKGTPTMVVINRASKKGKKLAGTNEITYKNVQNAINTLKKL